MVQSLEWSSKREIKGKEPFKDEIGEDGQCGGLSRGSVRKEVMEKFPLVAAEIHQ
jgi:hypothetical protein